MSLLMPARLQRWMTEHYGSRRGFLLTWWHRLLYRFGRYRAYDRIDWAAVERLVFVCKGNVCRSAYAAALARARGAEAGSCGIEAGIDVPAHPEAIRTAASRGISLETHRTTPLQRMTLKKNDLLIAMEPWQAEYLARLPGRDFQCTLLGLWGGAATPHIHDPYGTPAGYFGHCFDQIDESVDEIIEKVGAADDR